MTLACPGCDRTEFESFRFGLSECSGCGLVVDPSAMSRSQSESGLQEEWFQTPEAARSGWVRLFERWKNARTLARVRRNVPPPARVLDVGAGSRSLPRAWPGRRYDG